MSELEYGPGIAVPYFKDQEDTLEADIKVIKTAISGMKWKGKVMLEMGRAFVASCGYYLTCVHECKKNNDRNYCIVDGGMHQIQYCLLYTSLSVNVGRLRKKLDAAGLPDFILTKKGIGYHIG